MNRFALLLLALGAAASTSHAQYASTLVPIVREDTINRDQALWVAGSISGSIPIGTRPAQAAEQLARLLPAAVLRQPADEPITVGTFAHLLLQLEETPPGFWYALFPAPFTAFEQLRTVGVLHGFPTSSALVGGADAVTIARRYMAYVEKNRPAVRP